jgi:hypothetical protein
MHFAIGRDGVAAGRARRATTHNWYPAHTVTLLQALFAAVALEGLLQVAEMAWQQEMHLYSSKAT